MKPRQHYANQHTAPAFAASNELRSRLKRLRPRVPVARLSAEGMPLQNVRALCWLNGGLHLVQPEIEHVRRWLDGEDVAFKRDTAGWCRKVSNSRKEGAA